MELPHKSERSSGTALLLIAIIIVGTAILSFFSVQSADDQNRRYLEERASTVAAALDAESITKLTGTPGDVKTTTYRELKSKLTALRQINSDVRSVYVTGNNAGEVFFYVDSEQPDTAYYSPPGEVYDEATPAFKNMFFSSPAPLVEGPVTDRFGSWVSGLAPIFDTRTGRVVAVIGIDVDAEKFNQQVYGALDMPIGVGLVLIIIVSLYELGRRRMARAARVRSELVSIASHELRSPLVGMRWAIEGLLKSVSNKAEEAKLKAVHESILHLQDGTEDILQFTSVTASNKLNLAPHDMRALLQEVCDTQSLVAQQKNVKLVFDDSWPAELMIRVDADKLKRGLLNVVSNAIKYTRNDSDVVLHYERAGKEHLISVTDHGIGIPKDEQHQVFGGFYRASNAKASGIKGTGLGLYLTRAILVQHKGSITFTSKEGEGATFTLHFPA